MAIKALDLITIAIPPALPAALTVGKLYAQNRLQARRIYCINSRVINVAGSINCLCFDKVNCYVCVCMVKVLNDSSGFRYDDIHHVPYYFTVKLEFMCN